MNDQPVPKTKTRFSKVVVQIPFVAHFEKLKSEAECALARFKEAKAELRAARRDLRAAKRSCKADRSVTYYLPVHPGEPGYENLPDTFEPGYYGGEFRWTNSSQPPAA